MLFKIKMSIAILLAIVLWFSMAIETFAYDNTNWLVQECQDVQVQDWFVDNTEKIEEAKRILSELQNQHGTPKYKTVEKCKEVCKMKYDELVSEERKCIWVYKNPYSGVESEICLPPKDVYEIMKEETGCNYGRLSSMISICWQESSYQYKYMNWPHRDWMSIWTCWVLYWSTDYRENVQQAISVLTSKKLYCSDNGNYWYSNIQECTYQAYNGLKSRWYQWYWFKIKWIFDYITNY